MEGNKTITRIEQEIREHSEREKELQEIYNKYQSLKEEALGQNGHTNGHETNGYGTNGHSEINDRSDEDFSNNNNKEDIKPNEISDNGHSNDDDVFETKDTVITNGFTSERKNSNGLNNGYAKVELRQRPNDEKIKLKQNGLEKRNSDSAVNSNPNGNANGTFRSYQRSSSAFEVQNRRYVPNVKKGIMQRFYNSAGKLSLKAGFRNGFSSSAKNSPIEPHPSDIYIPPTVATPEEREKMLSRNGFVSAEEKIKRELQEFKKREEELRDVRRKSQTDLMAVIEPNVETVESTVPSFDSIRSNGFSNGFGNHFSISKRSMSLADLCNTTEDELETPGASALIRQFEKLRN